MINKFQLYNGTVSAISIDIETLDALQLLPKEERPIFLEPADIRVAAYIKSETMSGALANRAQRLVDTDPLAVRHMRQELRFTAPEMEALAKKGKALTTDQFKELEAYTQALRDLPTTLKTWPEVTDADWPKKPAFMDKPSTQGV
jgi:hypothetical protein